MAGYTTKNNHERIGNIIIGVLETSLICLIIMYTRTIYAHLSNVNLHLNIILSVVLALLLLSNLLFGKFSKNNAKKYSKYLFAYYIFIFVYLVFSNIGDRSFFANFFFVLPGFLILLLFNKDENYFKRLFIKFIYVTVALAVVSLVFYIVGSLTNIISPNINANYDWSGERISSSYFFLHFNTQRVGTFGLQIWRNTGIFTEAPMYSLVLSAALAMNMFAINTKKKTSRLFSAIIAITIISTFSATGLVVVTLSIIAKVFLGLKDKKAVFRVLLAIATLALIALCVLTVGARSKMSTGSIRLDDYRASFKAWADHPLLGNGYNNEDAIRKYMSLDRSDYGLSNTLGVVLAEGGIYLTLFYLSPIIILLISYAKNKKYEQFIFYFLFLVLISTCIFVYTPLMFLMITAAYNSVIKRRWIDEKVGN